MFERGNTEKSGCKMFQNYDQLSNSYADFTPLKLTDLLYRLYDVFLYYNFHQEHIPYYSFYIIAEIVIVI